MTITSGTGARALSTTIFRESNALSGSRISAASADLVKGGSTLAVEEASGSWLFLVFRPLEQFAACAPRLSFFNPEIM